MKIALFVDAVVAAATATAAAAVATAAAAAIATVHRRRRSPFSLYITSTYTSQGANDRALAWRRGRGFAGAVAEASLPQRQGPGHQPSGGSRLRGGLQRGMYVGVLSSIRLEYRCQYS